MSGMAMIKRTGETIAGALQDGDDPFILQTYRYFLGMLAAITGLGFISYWVMPASAVHFLCALDGLIWVMCGWFGWRKPIALTSGLFVTITGLLMGPLAHAYGKVFLLSTVIALTAFGGLTLYAHISQRNFSFLRGFLALAFYILLANYFIGPLITVPFYHLAIAAFATLVFMLWILFDTSRIITRDDAELTPAEAAFDLVMDLTGLHRWLMELFDWL